MIFIDKSSNMSAWPILQVKSEGYDYLLLPYGFIQNQ